MKKLLAYMLSLVMILSFSACKKEEKRLDTPSSVVISESGLISWEETENAEYYTVTVNGKEHDVKETSYMPEDTKTSFTCTVTAKAGGYLSSFPSDEKTFTAKEDIPDITVGISGPSDVKSGGTLRLKKNIKGTSDKSARWEITEGGEFASIDEMTGLLTAKKVDGDKIIKVRCKSKAYPEFYGEKIITVTAIPKLTEEMLDSLKGDKITFDGYMNIDLYKLDSPVSRVQASFVSTLKTVMGTDEKGSPRWYAEYERADIDVKGKVYYKEHEGNACKVGVSFENEEEFFPMTEDDGETVISWEDAGLYNNFNGLSVSDFVFNEETWHWEYGGGDLKLAERMTASANPYEFKPDGGFSLLIDDGEILGITAKSRDDYSVRVGYLAKEELFAAVTIDDGAVIPVIEKFGHKKEHDRLKEAIANMREAKSYNLEYTMLTNSLQTNTTQKSGFSETVTDGPEGDDGLCYFRPFEIKDGKEGKVYEKNGGYGYREISGSFYNSFLTDKETGEFYALRAFKAGFEEAKPSFLFAAEIFDGIKENEDGSTKYTVNEEMMPVAAAFYKGVGNDYGLYGLYAARGYIKKDEYLLPSVTVKDVDGKPYITEAEFFYNMGLLSGLIVIEYGDFDKAVQPEGAEKEFEVRNVPSSWEEEEIGVLPEFNTENPGISEDEQVNALIYFRDRMFSKVEASDKERFVKEDLPFFGSVLGDAFGFGLTTLFTDSGGITRNAVVLYYDVPVDPDYTLNSSLKRIDGYLKGLGYTKNQRGGYSKGAVAVKPSDDGLDLKIYVWQI